MKEILTHIDFADGEYKFCETDENNLIVYINSWDDKVIKIIFVNPIQFIYREGSDIVGVFEATEETLFLKEALTSYYVEIPEDHPFKMFAIKDVDDRLFFEVIAEGISASKELNENK